MPQDPRARKIGLLGGMVDGFHLKVRPDLKYMTVAEMIHFKKLHAGGVFTVFRVKMCEDEECKTEIPKARDYCSKECYEKGLEDDE